MRYSLIIPPNTPQGSPISQTVYFTGELEARVMSWTVRIPLGHCYLAGLQVRAGRAGRVVPGRSSATEWLVGNGDNISGGGFQLDPPQYAIELRGYNEDDTFSHTFYIDLD